MKKRKRTTNLSPVKRVDSAAVEVASSALMGVFTEVGIDDDSIRQTREKVTSGTSALIAMTSAETAHRFRGSRIPVGVLHPGSLQKEPRAEPRATTAARARSGPRIPTTAMSR